MDKVAIYTLGCKANQADSDVLASGLHSAGLRVVNHKERADICIVNTCTVTSKASYQSRQAIRRLIKNNPGSKIIVTGCDAEVEKEVLEKIPGVMNVVGTRDREKILFLLQRSEEKISTPKITTNRARPFVRIQDGCENYCSYCIVPYTRGKLQSVPEKDVVEAIRRISDQGYYEVVLTGIHIGAYGKEPGGKGTLPGLLQKLLLETGISRIRLSSIDPDEIDDTFIRLIAESNGRIAPHLHIPLQSGCDTTLKRMKRKYSTKLYLETVNALRKSLPDIAIGADVITGFIGENDEEFKTTYNFIKDLPVTYLHVFTYSDRKGTEAFLLPEKVDEAVKKERAKRLRELSTDKRIRYLKSNIGKAVTVVFDKKKTNGYWKGVSENYITVLVEQIDNKASHHQVRLQKVAGETIIGSIYEVNI